MVTVAVPGEAIMKLPRSVAGWTIAVFGVLALVMGALGLLWPEAQLRMLGFEVPATRGAGDYTGTFVLASSMASFNMGVYYLLATVTEWRAFYRFTVVFRLVTFTVFSIAVLADIAPDRFFGVAAWEGLGAVATAIGLRVDNSRRAAPVAASAPASATVAPASAPASATVAPASAPAPASAASAPAAGPADSASASSASTSADAGRSGGAGEAPGAAGAAPADAAR
ncbi:hypothetical protein GCM10009848_50990 [Micromonospora lupini]